MRLLPQFALRLVAGQFAQRVGVGIQCHAQTLYKNKKIRRLFKQIKPGRVFGKIHRDVFRFLNIIPCIRIASFFSDFEKMGGPVLHLLIVFCVFVDAAQQHVALVGHVVQHVF